MSETLIRIKNLTKRYDNVTPLCGVNLDIHKGDIIAVIGPSGTGKSTLIRMQRLRAIYIIDKHLRVGVHINGGYLDI